MFDSIDVINHVIRPLLVNVEHGEPMRHVVNLVQHHNDIAGLMLVANWLCLAMPAWAVPPGKKSSLRIVFQQVIETFMRQCRIEIAHAVCPQNKGVGSEASCLTAWGFAHFIG